MKNTILVKKKEAYFITGSLLFTAQL